MKTTGFFTFGPRRTALSSTIAPRSSKPGRKVQSPFLQNAMPMSRTQVNEVLWFLSWVPAPFAMKSSSDRVAFTKHLNADWRFWLHCDALPWGTPFDFQDSTSTKLLIELSWTYCPFFNSDLEPIAACLEFLSRGSWEGQDQAIHSSFCTVPSLVHMVSESQHSDTSDTSIYYHNLLYYHLSPIIIIISWLLKGLDFGWFWMVCRSYSLYHGLCFSHDMDRLLISLLPASIKNHNTPWSNSQVYRRSSTSRRK